MATTLQQRSLSSCPMVTRLTRRSNPLAALAQASASTDLFHEPPPAAEKSGLNEDARNVVSELITLLMRNRVLTDTEGKNLLRKLMTS